MLLRFSTHFITPFDETAASMFGPPIIRGVGSRGWGRGKRVLLREEFLGLYSSISIYVMLSQL